MRRCRTGRIAVLRGLASYAARGRAHRALGEVQGESYVTQEREQGNPQQGQQGGKSPNEQQSEQDKPDQQQQRQQPERQGQQPQRQQQ